MCPSPVRHLALLAPLLLAAAGCVGPGIAWLPDSTGFVYTGGKGKFQLLLFDVKDRKSRVLLPDVDRSAWPAVSPDGRRIAVAFNSYDSSTDYRLDIFVLDRAGKVLHRSPPGLDACRDMLQVFWSPGGDKLLVSEEYWARIYDLRTQKLTRVPGPAVTFGTTPVRPDGKAFLVRSWEDEYRLVDWDGKVQAITPGYDALIKGSRAHRMMLILPLYADSGWDGPVATVSGLGSRFRVDTTRLTLTMEEYKTPRTDAGALVPFQHRFPKGVTVRVVGETGVWGRPVRVEVIRPGRDPETIVSRAHYVKFFPSPDGKLLAVHWAEGWDALYGHTREEQARIVLVDAEGGVVTDMKVWE